MEHFLVPLFLLVVFVVRLLSITSSRAARDARPKPPPGRDASPAPEAGEEEERMRRFMDAVGLPPGSPPPPLVQPRPAAANPLDLPQIQPPSPRQPIPPGRLRPAQFPPGSPLVPRSAAQPAPVPSPHPAPRPVTRPERALLGEPLRGLHAPAEPAPVVLADPTALPTPEALISGRHVTPAILRPQQAAAAPAKAPPPAASLLAHSLLTRLRDPVTLREAVILREILGPPKGLSSPLSPRPS